MARERCFALLEDINRDANEIRFRDDARLKELFEMTVAADNNRLKKAETCYNEALENHEKLKIEAEEHRKLLKLAKEELHELETKCQRLENKDNMPNTRMTEDALKKLQSEIKNILNILKMYKDFTGVRFEFKNYPQAVVGCVLVKGAIPAKSVLRPFCIKKPYLNVIEEIWAEISAAVEDQL